MGPQPDHGQKGALPYYHLGMLAVRKGGGICERRTLAKLGRPSIVPKGMSIARVLREERERRGASELRVSLVLGRKGTVKEAFSRARNERFRGKYSSASCACCREEGKRGGVGGGFPFWFVS